MIDMKERYESEEMHDHCIYCDEEAKDNIIHRYGYVCPKCRRK